jgi:hypothetical protein
MIHPTYGRVMRVYSAFQANENPDLRLLTWR